MKIRIEVKDEFKRWLQEDGINFFTDIYKEHGELNVCLDGGKAGDVTLPHPVHFREGMQVRNWMRGIPEYLKLEQEENKNLDEYW